MLFMAATISVSQSEANTFFLHTLVVGEELLYKDLKGLLENNFPGINANQCSGLIHRAHENDNAVLEKVNKTYRLLPTPHSSNSELDNSTVTVQGINKVKARIKGLLNEIEKIPVNEFETAEDFILFKEIQSKLQELSN